MSDQPKYKIGQGQKIRKTYAWIAEEPDGESVVASYFPRVGFVPLIGVDRDQVEALRRHAARAARETGYPIRLKVFSEGTVIDQIGEGEQP